MQQQVFNVSDPYLCLSGTAELFHRSNMFTAGRVEASVLTGGAANQLQSIKANVRADGDCLPPREQLERAPRPAAVAHSLHGRRRVVWKHSLTAVPEHNTERQL